MFLGYLVRQFFSNPEKKVCLKLSIAQYGVSFLPLPLFDATKGCYGELILKTSMGHPLYLEEAR